MFSPAKFAAVVLSSLCVVSAATTWNVTVGSSSNESTTFSPQLVEAQIGDTVVFQFVNGTHTVTQSTFDQPCVFITNSTPTEGGISTGPRTDGVQGLSITNNQSMFFYDQFTCGNISKAGGVMAIDTNEKFNSTVTIAGFIRNAERLFGPNTTSSSLAGNPTGSSASASASASGSSTSNSNNSGALSLGAGSEMRAVVMAGIVAVVGGIAVLL